MGLSRSIARRAELAKGEPLGRALKIFFGSRSLRRDLQKQTRIAEERRQTLDGLIDVPWYVEAHGIGDDTLVSEHYEEVGRDIFLAPRAELAGPDGRHLSQWGAEYLVRSGVTPGSLPGASLPPGDPAAMQPFGIRNEGSKRIAVVTANFGGYDRLLPIDEAWKDTADFYLLTDRRFHATGGWQPVHATYTNVDPRRQARFYKLHLPTHFSAYDWVVWIDSNLLMTRHPAEIIAAYGIEDLDFATFRHWDRKSLVGEAAKCNALGKEDQATILRHMQSISRHPAFATSELLATMVLFMRPRRPAVRRLCDAWWRLLINGSVRDQLSLPIAIASAGDLKWDCVPEPSFPTSLYFAKTQHL